MRDGNFRPPHRIHIPWPITKKFDASDYVGDPHGCAKLVQIRPRGLLGKWVKYNKIFILLFIPFFGNSRTSQTHVSNDADSRKGVPFGGFIHIVLHFEGEIPQNPNFWGVSRRFQAKRAKYWKFHIIETTASISTKFCATIATTKWSS